MTLKFLASFSNSRVFPRPATTNAVTSSGSVNPDEVELAIVANENMTYATLRNISTKDTLYYTYRNAEDIAPTSADIVEDGMILEAGDSYDIEAKKHLYVTTVGGDPVPYRLDRGEG